VKKKILYIHHGKGLGGAPLSLLYLIQSLDRTLYDPVVLFLHQSEVMDLYKSKGIQVFGPANVYDFAHTKIWWFSWYHIHHLWRAARGTLRTVWGLGALWIDFIKPHVIHLNTSSLVGWAIVARKKKIPVVWHIREPLAEGYFGLRRKFIQWSIQHHADAIVPICKNDAQPWSTSDKTKVVYNAVHEDVFVPGAKTSDFLARYDLSELRPKILFVGGHGRSKGALEILQIFTELLERLPQAQLLIAGYFDLSVASTFRIMIFDQAHYHKQAVHLVKKLGDSVKLLGPILDIPAAMAASDVIVFPATVGHFARPVIEAGFMKKPVVVSALAPLNELVVNNVTGFLIDLAAQQSWVEALFLLLTNQAVNKAMGDAAYIFCKQHFSLDIHTKKIELIYAQLFSKKKDEVHG
jgi:glycosyltransferase involved in cell wall biosynthesis